MLAAIGMALKRKTEKCDMIEKKNQMSDLFKIFFSYFLCWIHSCFLIALIIHSDLS